MSGRDRARLWHRLRLVVVDLETASQPDKGVRIVSAAAVSCVRGKVVDIWSAPRVNPEMPIDAGSIQVHGIEDRDVAGAATFASVAPGLLPHLAAAAGEQIVVVAHNTAFDVPVLRAELERVGLDLPELPVLDTMGALPKLVGLAPADNRLETLVAELGVPHIDPHSALGDAKATAMAACELLNRAADAGKIRLAELLDELGGRSTRTLRPILPGRGRRAPEHQLPAVHIAGHAAILARPRTRASRRWLVSATECASLRCEHLAARLDVAAPLHADTFEALTDELVRLATAAEVASAATLLGALAPHFGSLRPAKTGRREQAMRNAAVALDGRLGVVLDPLGCCPLDAARCPSCRAGDPCPLDTWRLALATTALGENLAGPASTFFWTTGQDAGRQTYQLWRMTGHPPLADAALRLVFRYWRSSKVPQKADDLARIAVDRGTRDPEVAAARARSLANAGRAPDLDAALAVCDSVLDDDRGSAEDAWKVLRVLRVGLASRRHQLDVRPAQLHRPVRPRRSRPPRFLRT